MELLAEIIVNLLLLVGVYLVRWCIRHKDITLAIVVVAMMVVDVIVIFKFFR